MGANSARNAVPWRRSRWFTVNVIAAALTTLNGIVVGYGALWFQLFGESPDRDDYLVSMGGYAAAAVLVAMATMSNFLRRWPVWFTYSGGIASTALGLGALVSWSNLRIVKDPGLGISGVWDGVGGVIALPWSWAIVVLFLLSVRRPRPLPRDLPTREN